MSDTDLAAAHRALYELLTEGAERIGRLDLTETERLEGLRWLWDYTGVMVDYHTRPDPARPVVLPMVTPFRRFHGDLPLARHCYVGALDAAWDYRLTLRPGTADFVSVTVHADEVDGMPGNRSFGSLTGDELVSEPDGSIEIGIGRRPQGSNIIAVDDDVSSLMTREFFSDDPANRRHAQWHIEAVGGPAAGPPDAGRETEAMHGVVRTVRAALDRYPLPAGKPLFREAAPNTFTPLFGYTPGAVITWGNVDATHTTMAYDLGPGEALQIEGGPVVPCAWWGLSQNNRFLAGFDAGGPTAVAGARLVSHDDGCWRVTLAADDPGTGDWLCTGGRRHGILRIRWLRAERTPQVPATSVVALADLTEPT